VRNHQMRVAIQRNPISGSGRRDLELKEMVAGLKEAGLKPYLFTNRERLAHHLEDPDFRKHLLCIVAAGGDGTVDDLINRYPGVPLAIFAMGTENLLAKHCGMPRHGREVARVIASRHIREIDLGQVGTHRFAVMASCGFDAEVVRLAHEARKGRITKLHYLRPILQTFAQFKEPPLKLFCDEDPEPYECQMAIISNIAKYALNLPINPDAGDRDGKFSVCMIEKAAPWRLVRYFLKGMLKGNIKAPGIRYTSCERLRIESDPAVSVQADGDPVGRTPLDFQVLPEALTLLVPESFATSRLEEAPELEASQTA